MGALTTRRLSGKTLRELAAELVLLGTAFPLYYLVRGFTQERVALAFENAADLIGLERSLGIFREEQLQEAILPHGWLVDAFNAVYLYGHLPMIFVVAVWLYFWHRPQYLLMRNAVLISGAIGLVVYATFPVAPPRFLPELGFTDTSSASMASAGWLTRRSSAMSTPPCPAFISAGMYWRRSRSGLPRETSPSARWRCLCRWPPWPRWS